MHAIGNKESLSSQAYQMIKKDIISGKIRPKEILKEEKLSNTLGISRTPVRDALKRLQYDHLVEVNESRNVVVSEVSVEDYDYAIEARRIIELETVRLLAQTITKKQLKILESIYQSQCHALHHQSFESFLELECEFHYTIARFCGNPYFMQFMDTIAMAQQRCLILSGHLVKDWESAMQEHWMIIQSLHQHSEELAVFAMKKHIENVNMRLKEESE